MWCESDEGAGATFGFTLFTPVIRRHTTTTTSSTSKRKSNTLLTPIVIESQDMIPIPCPIVNRRLHFPSSSSSSSSSPRMLLLVSSHPKFSDNMITQLSRWGLSVQHFMTQHEASTFIKSLPSSSSLSQYVMVLIEYTVCRLKSNRSSMSQLDTPSSSQSLYDRSGPLSGSSTPSTMSETNTPASSCPSTPIMMKRHSSHGETQQPQQSQHILTIPEGSIGHTEGMKMNGTNFSFETGTSSGTGTNGNVVGASSIVTSPPHVPCSDPHELAHTIRHFETTSGQERSATTSTTSTTTPSTTTLPLPIFYLSSGMLLQEESQLLKDLDISFLRKPLLFMKLRTIVQNLITYKIRSPKMLTTSTQSQQHQQQRTIVTTKLSDTCPMSILIVEDNKINAKLITKILRNMGYLPECTFNGHEACTTILEKRKHFDLILMDMILPIMDGLEASETILTYYQQHHSKHPPPIIIAMTASAMEEDKKACKKAGMVDFVAKVS